MGNIINFVDDVADIASDLSHAKHHNQHKLHNVNSGNIVIFFIVIAIFATLILYLMFYKPPCDASTYKRCEHPVFSVKARFVGLFGINGVSTPDENSKLKDYLWTIKDNALVPASKEIFILNNTYIVIPAVQFIDTAGNKVTSKVIPKLDLYKTLTTDEYEGSFFNNAKKFLEQLIITQNTEDFEVFYNENDPTICYL